MTNLLKQLLASTLLLSFDSLACAVDEPDSHELQLATERAIVFKDGYCLMIKKGVGVTDDSGVVYTDDVPDAAVLGSFWAVPQRGSIRSMIAGWRETKSESSVETDCTSIMEIVAANVGKECSFITGSGIANESAKIRTRGTILKVLTTLAAPNPSDPLVANLHQSTLGESIPGTHQFTVSRSVGNFFVLRTEAGDMMVAANSVRDLLIEEMVITQQQLIKKSSRQKRLSFQFDAPNAEVEIRMMYFRPGVRWIPTYRINLTEEEVDEKKIAQLALQAEILNEAEDLVDTPIDVVVGVPNFRFRSVPSPMILEATLQNLLLEAAPQIMGASNGFQQMNSVSNALYTQRSGEFRSARATGDQQRTAPVDMPEELTGRAGNDLFVYSLPATSLRRGERATIPILSTKVPYRDVFTWDIELTHSETYAASSSESISPLVFSENKIWRQVELINDTELPWTTGAAMFVDGLQPLAQELLTYTSPGGICRVPVTVAVDLRGKVTDREVDRKLNAMKWRGHDYARVLGEIEIELANNKLDDVPIEVAIRFGGKAKQVTENGQITLEPYRPEDWTGSRGDVINNSSLVRWTSSVAPGECFKPTIQYDFVIRY